MREKEKREKKREREKEREKERERRRTDPLARVLPFFVSHSKLCFQQVFKKKRRRRKNKEIELELAKEIYGTGFPILMGLLSILNFLVFVVCWALQMRKKLV